MNLLLACSSEPSPNEKAAVQTTAASPIEGISKLIAASPDEPDLYVKRAALYYQNEQYKEAAFDLSKAISIDSMQVMYYHNLADVYLDANKSLAALETMNKASNLFPKRIPTLLKLSEFQLILKKNQDSFRTLDRLMKVDPQNAEAFFMMGLNFKELGDEKRAINSFQSAVENNPDLVDAWIELGYLLDKTKNPLAGRYFDNALRMDSSNILALEAKGNHLGGQGKFEEAIKTYQKITKIDRQYPNAYYNIGLAYLQIDSIEQAYRHFDISTKVDPVYTMGYFYRAYVWQLKGNKEAAKKDYEQVLRLNPDFERAKEALSNLK